jgi:Cof subfamily protein (haloacid dehalogenase superfamily)
MYRLVVCDLDGTLLRPDHRLGDYTQRVLGRLREHGVELMLASGRHFQDIRALARQLGGHGCLISSNGAAVHDRLGQPVQLTAIEPDCAELLIRDPLFSSVHVNVYRAEDWLVGRPEPRLLVYHQYSGFAYRVTALDTLPPDGVLKVFYYGEPQLLHEIEAELLARAGDRVSTTFSLPVTLEVMARGVSKGAALARVIEPLGIGLGQVLAFGDGMNDREMLECAGKGVLMGNADPRLQAALPHLERIGTNADESVARYLEAAFLAE